MASCRTCLVLAQVGIAASGGDGRRKEGEGLTRLPDFGLLLLVGQFFSVFSAVNCLVRVGSNVA